MLPHFFAVDEAQQLLVRRSDVQQHPANTEALRQGEFSAVLEGTVFMKMLPNAGKMAFRAEGYQDFSVKGAIAGGKLPLAV